MKLEEEQIRLIESCTASKTNHVDLNKCMPVENMNISRSQHKCTLCDHTFETSYSPEVHVVDVHDKEKLNQCDKCEAKFLFKCTLRI